MSSSHDYEIRVGGHLAGHWSEWFDGLTVVPQADGSTILRGPLTDQAALQGVLLNLFNLGLSLIAVTPSPDSIQATASPSTPREIE